MAEKHTPEKGKAQPDLPRLKADPMVSPSDRPDGEELRPDLKAIQVAAAHKGKVQPVPLVSKKSAAGEPDPGPPAAPVAHTTPAPRVIHPNERAPRGSGLTRFKIRCLNYGPSDQPTRYVLAASEAEARKHYLEYGGLRAVFEALTDGDGKFHGPEPRLFVKALED